MVIKLTLSFTTLGHSVLSLEYVNSRQGHSAENPCLFRICEKGIKVTVQKARCLLCLPCMWPACVESLASYVVPGVPPGVIPEFRARSKL